MILTESNETNCFRSLNDDKGIAEAAGWNLQPTGDERSLTLTRHANETMMIVAGRQIISSERLEVLALGCSSEFEDGLSLKNVLARVVETGAVAVIPWGFGKWWGRRGTLVGSYLKDGAEVPFSLGDNGGRPSSLPRPRLFVEAERAGISVLPGSDPLPIRSHETRAGSYGFAVSTDGVEIPTVKTLIDRIGSLPTSPQTFGQTSSLSFAIRSQVELRLARRGRLQRTKDLQSAP